MDSGRVWLPRPLLAQRLRKEVLKASWLLLAHRAYVGFYREERCNLPFETR
jgi:hypothetical protein